jgi:hypothetical protein
MTARFFGGSGGRFVVDLTLLRDMADRLGAVGRDLDATHDVPGTDPAALGVRVAGSLDRFTATSTPRRRELAALIDRLSTLVAGAADSYRSTDDAQAIALADPRMRS